jgi:hypothetical protein
MICAEGIGTIPFAEVHIAIPAGLGLANRANVMIAPIKITKSVRGALLIRETAPVTYSYPTDAL